MRQPKNELLDYGFGSKMRHFLRAVLGSKFFGDLDDGSLYHSL